MVSATTERPEMRYGVPAADQILLNRHYSVGYSYYFRQAKWALEIVDPDKTDIERIDNFRPDYRIPPMFRADLEDYSGSGYDRGHLVASANQIEIAVQNSETFLLSNMAPQHPDLNRRIWRDLETAIRELNANRKIFETYVICGPIFNFDVAVNTIGAETPNQVTLPIPHAFFKSVLTEDDKGRLKMWSFIFPNRKCDEPLEAYLVPTRKVEQYAGLHLWSGLLGPRMDRLKERVAKMW
jgi:endonuclease G